MTNVQTLNEKHLNYFSTLIDQNQIITDPEELKNLGVDWTKVFEPNPSLCLFPKSTLEVSKILGYCHDHNILVVPSGGRTGLCAGAVANQGEVILSLTKMNKITSVDVVGMTIRSQAGVTTQELQEAADSAGLFFPLDLAAKGSSQIGGNLATNAGGLKLIRYGGAREQVLGIEVVLANGEILDLDHSLRKNNTGYDLKHLFIGAEGTLGVITNVTLKLVQKPKNVELICLGVDSFQHILSILRECNLSGIQISAFEFFTKKSHELVLKCFPQSKSPFEEKTPYYLLLEVEADRNEVEELIEKSFEKELLLDGVISQSSSEFNELWSLRENITESIQASGHVRKNDISLPIADLDKFVDEMLTVIEEHKLENIDVLLFGHIGDGNIHLNYLGDKSLDFKKFSETARQLEEKVFELLPKYKGSISAEHGIGLTKKKDLHFSCSEVEISLMKKIKVALDPRDILNPGKIFDI